MPTVDVLRAPHMSDQFGVADRAPGLPDQQREKFELDG